MTAYRALRGLTYGNRRAEAGDIVTDLPSTSVKWLTDQGIVEQVEGSKPSKTVKRERVSDDKGDE
jgi:hypothetical protein